MLSMQVVSNLIIAISYYGIAALLFSILRLIVVPVSRVIVVLFAWFILACGTTHVMEILVVWYPWYWLQIGVLSATAVPSLATLIYLYRMKHAILDHEAHHVRVV